MEISSEQPTPSDSVQHLNPDALPRTPAFTQAVVVSGPTKTIYIVHGQPIQATFEAGQR